MLGIKIQTKKNADDTVDLRLLSSVDSLDYDAVGFQVWYGSAASNPTSQNVTATFTTTTVLERIGAGVSYNFSPQIIDTSSKYFVTGTIVEVYNTTYGNMKIVDEAGNILTVYGTYGEDGEVRYDSLLVKPVAGDVVTVYGIVGQYNGTPQVKNGWIVDHVDNTPETEPATTEPETEPVTEPATTEPETTEPVTEPATTEPVTTEPETTEPETTEATPVTTEKEEPTTEAPGTEPKPEEPAKSGCGSVAGFGALAIVAIAAVGLVSFKKKED
jgi:hypothetical protein